MAAFVSFGLVISLCALNSSAASSSRIYSKIILLNTAAKNRVAASINIISKHNCVMCLAVLSSPFYLMRRGTSTLGADKSFEEFPTAVKLQLGKSGPFASTNNGVKPKEIK